MNTRTVTAMSLAEVLPYARKIIVEDRGLIVGFTLTPGSVIYLDRYTFTFEDGSTLAASRADALAIRSTQEPWVEA